MSDDLLQRKKDLLLQRLAETGLSRSGATEAVATPKRSDGESTPVAAAQRRLWFVSHSDPADTTLNVGVAYRLTGNLDPDRLRAAVDAVIARHEVLRATYEPGPDGDPIARHHSSVTTPWTDVDISELTDRSRDRRLQVLARREFGTPFDLRTDRPIRVVLVRLGQAEHALLMTVHHIAWDDESWAVFFTDLNAAYRAEELGSLPRQYADLPAPNADVVAADVDFWRTELTPLPESLDLAAGRRADHQRRNDRVAVPVPGGLAERIDEFARANSVSPFLVHVAATDAIIHRITGATDFTVAVPVTTRPGDAAALIGYFGNTVLLRTRLSSSDGFGDLLAAARDRLVDGVAHQHAPVDVVVSALNPDRRAGGGLEQIVSVSVSTRRSANGFDLDGVTASDLDELGLPNGQLPLEFSVVAGDQPRIELEFDTDVFTATMARGIVDAYLHVIGQAIDRPTVAIRDLELLDPTARSRALERCAGAVEPIAATTLVELFAAVAAERAGHQALASDDRSLTYRELDEQSNQLAHWLIGQGCGPEGIVGLQVGGSIGFVVAALATLKSGAAYLPIDPGYPAERVELLVSDARPELILDADSLSAAQAEATTYPTSAPTDADRRAPLRPENLAYIIYTSGSTGTPKGVPVAHHAIAEHLVSFRANGVVTADDRLVQTSSVSFDASLFDIFGTLSVGGTVVLPKPGAMHDIPYLADLLIRQQVTVMHMVPTVLTTLMKIPAVKQWTMLRAVPVGGEALAGDVADAFTTAFDTALSNNYGPTEAVVAATHYAVDGPQGSRIVPIGRPNHNVTSYLLDAGLRLVPDGVVGEIYLGGSQLARGYLGRATATASRFVADPFGSGGRLYCTGDLARRNDDGELEFVGRADEQVKVRGFRIELGEVEAALAAHPDVSRALALIDADDSGARLVAYLIPRAGVRIDLDAVTAQLRSTVPEQLVPSALAVIDDVPLTTHGKLDRDALPTIDSAPTSNRAPRTPTEKRIAGIYATLFGRDDVGAESSFFDLGGHSLLAARLVTTLTTEFGIDVDVRLPLDHPTVEGLAAAVNDAVREEFGIDLDEFGDADELTDVPVSDTPAGATKAGGRPPLTPTPHTGPIPLSFSQLAMWFQQRFETTADGAAANIPLTLQLTGPLDPDALALALNDVVARHDSLRTTFVEADGLPVAVISDVVELDLPIVDVASPDELGRLLTAARTQTFDLAAAPLIRARLVRTGPDAHVLALVVHHMLIDHASTAVVVADLVAAYRSRCAGHGPVASDPAGLTYTDFALWQHRVFPVGTDIAVDDSAAEYGVRQIEYWRAALADQPDEISVATDRPRPTALTKDGVHTDFTVSPAGRSQLRALADESGATEFMAITAALTGLLSRLGGGDDIAIGTPVAGRVDPGTDALVGLYANMVPLRTRTDGDPTIRELIGRTRNTVLGAFANQDVPIERLVEALNPRRTRSRNPLFQSMIHFRDDSAAGAEGTLDQAGDTHIRLLPVEQDTSFLDLNVILLVTPAGGLEGRVVASADLYDADTVAGIAAMFAALLEAFGDSAATELSAITLPALPGVLTPTQHADDPAVLATLIAADQPRRVVAAPRTLAALQHSGATDFGSVREWVTTAAGATATLAETLEALSPGSRLRDPFADAPVAVVALASTLGGGTETPTEARIVAILGDLLGVDGLGRDDNFFAVGGDSVISIQLAARAAAEGIALTPQQIFDYYSIAELAAAVDEAAATEAGPDESQAAPMSASGLDDAMLGALGAAWKAQQ